MPRRNPFRITVYGPDLGRRGWVGNPSSATFTPRDLAQGSGQIVVNASDPITEYLLAEGARVGVTYKGEHLLSGPVTYDEGDVLDHGTITFQVKDDWIWLSNPALVVPAGHIAAASLTDKAQSYGGTNDAGRVDGRSAYYNWGSNDSMEQAIKRLLSDNLVTWLGLPIVVRPNGHRGGPATDLPQVRFGTLSEIVVPLLRRAGLSLRIWQPENADHLELDVWQPKVWPQVLSSRAGIVQRGRWSRTRPTVTRAVVGGPGELQARALLQLVNTSAETATGFRLAKFIDSTSAKVNWDGVEDEALQNAIYYLLRPEVSADDKATFLNALTASGTKVLTEGGAKQGLSMELSETRSFQFMGADGFHLGDRVTVRAQGIEFSESITEAALSIGTDGKLSVKPQVGEKKDDQTRALARAIAALASSQRRQATSR